MSAIFNRRFPIQTFATSNLAGAAVIPGKATGISFADFPIAVLVFIATATASSTRTASVTATVTFVATGPGTQLLPNTLATISQEPDLAGNIFNQGQSITTASPVW